MSITEENTTTRRLWIFLAWAFGLGWLLQGIGILQGVQTGGTPWLMATMWAPALAVLLTGSEARRQAWAALKRSGGKTWLIALGLGVSFSIAQQVLLWTSHRGQWNSANFPLNADGSGIAAVHHMSMVLGVGPQGFGLFYLNVLVSVGLSAVLFMPLGAIGEEIGWRGLLQPALAKRFGAFKGTVLVGLIWAYWHIPANLAGFNDAEHPVLTTFVLFPVFCVAFAFVLAWLVQRTGSLWPAALAHVANNNMSRGPLILPAHWQAEQIANFIAAVVIGIVGIVLLIRFNKARVATTTTI